MNEYEIGTTSILGLLQRTFSTCRRCVRSDQASRKNGQGQGTTFPLCQRHSLPSQHLTREVKIWKDLNHPNIIKFIGYAIEGQGSGVKAALVSKWCENGDIVKYLTEHPMTNRIKLVGSSGYSVIAIAVALMFN